MLDTKDTIRNIIIGSGVIGRATGEFLEAHKKNVTYNDINIDILTKLKEQKKRTEKNINNEYDLYWICTAEWHVSNVLKKIKNKNAKIVIRSTIKPNELRLYKKIYHFEHLAHMPEFLREKTALNDIFNSDRIIIGTYDSVMVTLLEHIFTDCNCPKIFCTPEESSLIKLTANSWLAMQISFWNEIKKLSDIFDNVNPQLISNGVTMDHRISKYGSNMIGRSFCGFCFPKDTKSLKEVFEDNNLQSKMIDALIKVNEEMK